MVPKWVINLARNMAMPPSLPERNVGQSRSFPRKRSSIAVQALTSRSHFTNFSDQDEGSFPNMKALGPLSAEQVRNQTLSLSLKELRIPNNHRSLLGDRLTNSNSAELRNPISLGNQSVHVNINEEYMENRLIQDI